MSIDRIQRAFASTAFVAFITGGDPSLEATRRYVNLLVDCGVDMVEIGVPFSDPIAEGPVIQQASQRALAHDTTVHALFDLVRVLREDDGVAIPLAMMTYLNPVHHYGYDAFFARAAAVGVDALIIPDLPFEEHGEVRSQASAASVALISMIAPTSSQRVRMIAAQAEGFIYVVSSLGVTGARSAITTDIGAMVRDIRSVTDVPAAVGFGISTPDQAHSMATQADGVIVGSAIVDLIARHGEQADAAIADFVRPMVEAAHCG
ncbi:MAG: tryptophan synthase subunit alpha [Propionibacteriaceae bacterium]|jgi:tryptophan synthase alpha chain|nr:tryptophan synthase subunit alpha [Propionibacteriaceae bacterium]